jgi:hypothetical protein
MGRIHRHKAINKQLITTYMKSQAKIIQKFKPTKINGTEVDFYSDVQVWKMIDMAYEQIRNKEEISEPMEAGAEFYCTECGRSIYSCRC